MSERSLCNPDVINVFLKNVREINYESPISLTEKDQEFIDIDEFASIVKTTPREILRRIGTGNIPPDLFYFSKEASSRWADEIGADYFKRSFKGYEVQNKKKSKYL